VIGSESVTSFVTVSNVTAEDCDAIAGLVTILAAGDDGIVAFTDAASTFHSLAAQADAGIRVNVDLTTTVGGIYLDGDTDDSSTGDSENSVAVADGRSLVSAKGIVLEALSGLIRPSSAVSLLAKSGVSFIDSMSVVATGSTVTVNTDTDANGDGTLSVAQGKTLHTNNGPLLITTFDIDLNGTIDAGTGSLTVYASLLDQSIGLGAVVQDMHVTDAELLKMTAKGSIIFERNGEGTMVVHSVSRKYATQLGQVVFGGTFFTNPAYSQYIVSSKHLEANIDQIVTKTYLTQQDFEDRLGMGRFTVPRFVELGTDMGVEWVSDIYTERVSQPGDWIGLYRAGECDDDSDVNFDSIIHKCWLAWQDVLPGGDRTGRVTFPVGDYKNAGDYELRYFYGDSNGGQGYTCLTLGNVGETYKHCLLRARATSDVVSVVISGSGDMARAGMPGLQEHYCDGADGLCTW